MEPIIVIVGFLGAGKTTLLKKLAGSYLSTNKQPFILLNDYENANLDSQQFLDLLDPKQISALSGSCICCSGIVELRDTVNSIPPREEGVTLIEANGTTDAYTLMEFLAVGIKDHFLPPTQVTVVDARNWQQREAYNELERNQVESASLIVLNHVDQISEASLSELKAGIGALNPFAKVVSWNDLDESALLKLSPVKASHSKMDHPKSHWSSCSIDLPDPLPSSALEVILESIPQGILRVKGCTRLDADEKYTQFERIPSGETSTRPFHGKLVAGAKLLTVGPGSDPERLREIVSEAMEKNSF